MEWGTDMKKEHSNRGRERERERCVDRDIYIYML